MQTRSSLAALVAALLFLAAPQALAQDLSSPEACARAAVNSDTLPADFAQRCGPLPTRAPQIVSTTPTPAPVTALKGGTSCTIGTWQPAASTNTARSRPGLAYHAANGKFYLAGGEASGGVRDIPIEEYDPVGNTWTDRSLLNTGVSNTGVASWGAYLYIPGGFDGVTGTDAMQRFDPVGNSVTNMAPMPAGNTSHSVVQQDGKIYVLGGSTTGALGTTNYIYDIGADSWSTGAAVPVATNYPAATSDGTYLYLFGGDTGADISDVQRYDPVGDSWTPMPDMTTGRAGLGAFYDGENTWATNGGWSSYLASTEYNDGAWQAGPAAGTGARTLGAAFGGGMALKAAGWNGNYLGAAETLSIDCDLSPDISIAINTHGAAARGESVFFRGPVTNNGASTEFAYVYTEIELPGGATYKRNIGGKDLAPGETYQYKNFPKSKNYFPIPPNAPGGTYTITVYAASDNQGTVIYDQDSFQFTLPPLAAATSASVPTASSLEIAAPHAAPNPFRDATEIRYALSEDAEVDLRVYDVTGREVAALVSGSQSAGPHAATLRAGDLPGGVYVWRLAIGGEVTTGRVTLSR